MKFTELLKFGPPPPPWNPPPQGGMGKNKLYWFSGQFMTFPGLLIFWPPKIPTSTPPPWVGRSIFLGWNHPQICRDLCILNPFSDLFFAFKVTISRHFAGYASVALETIWLHEPRDLIFLGPPMTLLCLSRYSIPSRPTAPPCAVIHSTKSAVWRWRCFNWLLSKKWDREKHTITTTSRILTTPPIE